MGLLLGEAIVPSFSSALGLPKIPKTLEKVRIKTLSASIKKRLAVVSGCCLSLANLRPQATQWLTDWSGVPDSWDSSGSGVAAFFGSATLLWG